MENQEHMHGRRFRGRLIGPRRRAIRLLTLSLLVIGPTGCATPQSVPTTSREMSSVQTAPIDEVQAIDESLPVPSPHWTDNGEAAAPAEAMTKVSAIRDRRADAVVASVDAQRLDRIEGDLRRLYEVLQRYDQRVTSVEKPSMQTEEVRQQGLVEMQQALSPLRQDAAELREQMGAMTQTLSELSVTQESDRAAQARMFDEIIFGLERALSPRSASGDHSTGQGWSAPPESDRRP